MYDAIARWGAPHYWVLSAFLLCCFQSSFADSATQLRLEDAVDQTLARNPGLIALGYQLEARQGRVVQSEVAPPPELGLMVENVLGSGIYAAGDGAETTLSLGWVLERGKRQRHVDLAKAGLSAFEARTTVARLDAVADTTRLFLDVIAIQAHLHLSQQAVAMADGMVASVKRTLEAGRSPAADLARAEANLSLASLRLEDLEHELSTARRQLAAQWGDYRPEFDEVVGEWSELPAAPAFSSLIAQLDRAPSMALALSQRRLRESELRLAEARARPDWTIQGSVRRFELTDDHAFVASINIPLASAERNRGRVHEARAKLAAIEAERTATRLTIETQLFALFQELRHSRHRANSLREDVLPRLEEAEKQTREGYEAGRYSYFQLQEIQAELLANRAEFVAAAIDAHHYQSEIERLTGAAMQPAAPQSGESP